MESNETLMMVVIVILLTMYLWFRQKPNYNLAPKIIWTYWDRPSKSQELCKQSWKKWNPNYEIIVLTKKNYTGYVTIGEEIRNHPIFTDRFSDLIHLWVLAERGGVWMDPTILLTAPLDQWLFPKYAEFSGFHLDKQIQMWFMAVNKKSAFLKMWRDEFSELARFPNVEQYVESRKGTFSNISNPIQDVVQVSCQKVSREYDIKPFILENAEEGPMKYLVDAKWDSEKALELVCMDHSYQSPIMKMRENEQKVVEKKIGEEGWVEKCGFIS
jgi:hypothetical protein